MAGRDACCAFRPIGGGVGEAARVCRLAIRSRGVAADESLVTCKPDSAIRATYRKSDFAGNVNRTNNQRNKANPRRVDSR
jgi:hypothetical protein